MKARLLVQLAGEPMRNPGEIVEGEEAVRMCAVGIAEPIREEKIERAVKPAKAERAVAKKA